jgi:hypothetical protein
MKIVCSIFLLAIIVNAAGCGGSGKVTTSSSSRTTLSSAFSFIAVAGNNSVELSWSAVSGATSYNIYRTLSSPVNKSAGTKIASGIVGTTYSDTTVTNGTQYFYVMTSIVSSVESIESPEASAVPGSTGSISGKIMYQDKEIGPTGFTGKILTKAVRYAAVDVVDAANSNVLSSTQTDSLGVYSIATSTVWTTVYVRVNSIATPPASASITVSDLSNAKYGVPSQNILLTGSASITMAIPTTNTSAGAFNILDVMTTGFDFVRNLSGAYPTVPLNSFWEPGNPYGTYFCYGGCPPIGMDGIYVFSQTGGDTDEYDDDVLWHEFGHFVAHNYSLDVSPGGVHYLGDSGYDLRLAWSEGWGDFFPGAVKTWLSATNPGLLSVEPGMTLTTYLDTSGNGGFSFDFGNPPANANFYYSSNEVAVAKVLTDLQISPFTMNDIWDVFTGIKNNLPALTDPVNLDTFWDMWLTLKPTSNLFLLQGIYQGRAITYATDNQEPNDDLTTAATITVGPTGLVNLSIYPFTYLGVDKDYFKFTVTANYQYTISSSNLLNGADTYLRILAPDKTTQIDVQIAVNDNFGNVTYAAPFNCTDIRGNYVCHENGSDLLASRYILTSAMTSSYGTGTYYVEITSSASRPLSAGKYGSYTLKVTSP